MAKILDRLKGIFGWGMQAQSVRPAPDVDNPIYGTHNPSEMYHDMVQARKMNRINRYDIYDAMDKMSDVSSILDAYTEDATQNNHRTESTIWVEGKDSKIVAELNTLLKTLDIEGWIEGVTRDVGKFGDDFAMVHGNDENGITSLEWLDPRDVERVENREGTLLGFELTAGLGEYQKRLQDDPTSLPPYMPWDMIHWRCYKQKRLPHEKHRNIYGTSLMWSADRIAKQIKILDDLLMIVRLTRSLDRKIYYIDVGRAPVEEEVRILKRWRRALKRQTYMDPSTGRFDSRFNPYAFSEDEFWPTKEGINSKVETLPGMGSVGQQVDIDHFRDKFFGAFRAPKAFFGYEGDVNAKATLSSQSIRWSRSVNSLQRAVKTGVTRLCQIHLAWKGMETDVENFRILMVPPSAIELLDRLESWQSIVEIAGGLATLGETLELDKLEWTKYILTDVMWLSETDTGKFIRLLKQRDKSGELGKTTTIKRFSSDGIELKAMPVTVPPEDLPNADKDKEKEPEKDPAEIKKESLQEIDRVISSLVAGSTFSSQSSIRGINENELPRRRTKV